MKKLFLLQKFRFDLLGGGQKQPGVLEGWIDCNIKAVQLPLNDWKKVHNKLKEYEQSLKLKSDLKEAIQKSPN